MKTEEPKGERGNGESEGERGGWMRTNAHAHASEFTSTSEKRQILEKRHDG